jgi:hypothetical protein
MQRTMLVALVFALMLGGATPVVAVQAKATSRDDHPIVSVISLLQKLMATVEHEGHEEATNYEAFTHWCGKSGKALSKAIAKSQEIIAEQTAIMDAKTEEMAALTAEIAELEAKIQEYILAGENATNIRKEENDLYVEESTSFKETIKAVEAALDYLVKAKSSTASLLQAQEHVREVYPILAGGKHVTDIERQELESFLGLGSSVGYAPAPAFIKPVRSDVLAKGDQAKHVQVYGYKSDSVIELLKGLIMKFEDELQQCEDEEQNALNAYTLAVDARLRLKTAAEADRDTKTELKADALTAFQAAKEVKESSESDLKADSTALETTEQQCRAKEVEWQKRSEIRAGELEAMKAAVEILSKKTGVRTEAPSNPVAPTLPFEPKPPPSFLQVGSEVDPKMKAVQLLRKEARLVHSRALDRLAQRIAAHVNGPFDEVEQMIQKMIFHLKKEQTDEDNHKNWCDKELNTSTAMKENKEERMAKLKADIKTATAKVAELTADIAASQDMVQTIVAFMAESTELRKKNKEENDLAIKDAKDAQDAIAQALVVLQEFYKSSGMLEDSLLQQKAKVPVELESTPATWEASYTGLDDPTDPASGIIAVLQKTSADFAEMESTHAPKRRRTCTTSRRT